MISWLKGQIIHTSQRSTKKLIVLNVGGVGYEIQVLSSQIEKTYNSDQIEFWIHQIGLSPWLL